MRDGDLEGMTGWMVMGEVFKLKQVVLILLRNKSETKVKLGWVGGVVTPIGQRHIASTEAFMIFQCALC